MKRSGRAVRHTNDHRLSVKGGPRNKRPGKGRRGGGGWDGQQRAGGRGQGQQADHRGQARGAVAAQQTMESNREGTGACTLTTERERQGQQADHAGQAGGAVAAKQTMQGRREGAGACTRTGTAGGGGDRDGM